MNSSIFNDFSEAWTQRFPNCELPNAWEDDVRANLSKHQQKVTLLKEELEKEEFYVEYLQKLLEDVGRVKSKGETIGPKAGKSISASLSSKSSDSVENGVKSSESKDETKDDQYVTVITVSSYGEIQKPSKPVETNQSLIDNPLYQPSQPIVHNTPETSEPAAKESLGSRTTANQNNTSTEVSAQNQVSKKKRPPTPPRKPKVNKNLNSFLSLDAKSDSQSVTISSVPNTPDIETSNLLQNILSASKHQSNNSINDSNNLFDKNKLGIKPNDKSSDSVSTTPSQSHNILYDDDEDNIYDTVAPDEPPMAATSINDIKKLKNETIDSNSSNDNLSAKYYDLNSYANYVNIDYFLRKDETSSRDDSDDNETHVSQSLSSDHDIDDSLSHSELIKMNSGPNDLHSISSSSLDRKNSIIAPTYDEVFEEMPETDNQTNRSDKNTSTPKTNKLSPFETERLNTYKCIIASIAESEAIYVDCLSTLIQYMKALKSTIGTTHPLLTNEDLSTIFYKIPELYKIHWTFLEGLKILTKGEQNSSASSIGDLFKVLASRLGAYSAFLKNYSKALETIHKCSSTNNQFSEITRSIKIGSLKGQSTTLEELLHKPVARVQKNALVLHDLLKYTDEDQSNDYKSLKTALKMTQCFLNDLNIAATEQMFPVQDKTQRRLVKESFIVENSDEKRKLRHLFLFNDVIVCAKYKASAKQKFTFDLKWYNLLNEITILDVESQSFETNKEKEYNNNLLNIKSRLSNTRDLITKEEEKEKGKLNTKLLEKLKKKKLELEAQLVLFLPSLKFSISHKSGKIYSFCLSSDFERSQWIESIKVLQQSAHTNQNTYESINFHELQAWIETCRKNLNPNLGSFLLRSSKDEDLLYGDLYLNVHNLKGLSREADIFFALELDTYGHYLQRAATHVSKQSLEPHFEQEFVLDLDGTQTLRILCYEEIAGQQKPFFRGKASLELSQSWLTDKATQQLLQILDCTLSLTLRYVSSQSNTARFPASKVCGTFGMNVQQVCKKEKTSVPYLISSCIREVERRGMKEVGIYRVSGLSSDVQKLKKAFETNPYEADLLMKEVDIHAVTGLLKLYLRELPESLFTNSLYKKYFDAFNTANPSEKSKRLLTLFSGLTQPNQTIISSIIDHLYNVNQYEEHNKMSMHNLATVFGPTMLRPGSSGSSGTNNTVADSFTAGTIDVMAQAGILYFFLRRKSLGHSLTNTTTETEL